MTLSLQADRATEDIPLSARDLDRWVPGVLDGINILAGGANVIMQLSWPGVGHGVKDSKVESGSLFKHPFKRTRTTLTYLAVATMGTAAEKAAYAAAVNRVHAQVRSEPGAAVSYSAMDPNLQLWVAACLYRGFVDAVAAFRGETSAGRGEDFHARAAGLGTMLQVRPGIWPKDIAAFDAYWAAGLAAARIDPATRDFLGALADLRFLPAPLPLLFGRFNRFMTTGFLPPELRTAMGLPWDERRQRRFERVARRLGTLNALLPRVLRQAPFLLVLRDFRRRLRTGAPLV
ncbi:oxygenase MpaB family protein [Zavarzinia compransoris]|uniref:oxygenase MpaB family protein n=1 Tax=Zavarzinia marina TaxID=2911065 RepID=UPI001F397601|nr:oxygenase MpaB family protein [Zavarzinia marina]MCF4167196.1 oxygenase MpaB family protein [Zavarzinia marina]